MKSFLAKSVRLQGFVSRVVVCALVWSAGASAQETDRSARGKRALIIAVSEYASPDWDTLASGNDVPLVRAALELHGFAPESIHVLTDADATKQGMQDAIETYLGSAQPGDVVFLHYSGHGQRIADDNGDELDGLDEAWVPHDAPKRGDGYLGDKHLRDDELNRIIQRLRTAVGPSGNVILSIDSCFSGGTSRGTARVRGGPPILRTQSRGGASDASNDAGGGFFEERPRTRGAMDDPSQLAPYVVFSAARHDQLAYETVDDEGQIVGPLSFAMSKALAGSESLGTYRDLFERVEWTMQSRVPNRPQVEGDVDAELFSGQAIVQQPFVEVASVLSGGKQVALAAGSLQGLLIGSRVELHHAGAREPTEDTLLSAGVVSEASHLEAVVDLDTAARSGDLERARAFVQEYAFGGLRVSVSLDESARGVLEPALADVSAVEIVEADPELSVRTTPDGVFVDVAATGEAIFGPEPLDAPELSDAIRSRLVDYARSRYLRSLRIGDESFEVTLEVVPLDPDRCRDARDPSTCAELDPASRQGAGSEAVWRIGDYFKLRARNQSEDRKAYVTILDLPSDGTVGALWPAGSTSDRKQLKAGETWSPSVVYQFAEPPGNDVILLIATEEWTDFRPFLTGVSQQRSAVNGGALGPFAPLLNDESVRTRSAAAYDPGSVTTHAITITVEP